MLGLTQQRVSYLLIFADWIEWIEKTTVVVNTDFALHSVTERLFRRGTERGGTEEEIARVVGLKRPYVAQLLMFADWIQWFESVAVATNPEFTLHRVTERLFRKFWNKHSEQKFR